MRGRGNRKAPNPLSRNYESNGPDVKIRGNAQHIADKYTTLARDAQAAGDRVMAENYLQHAEHYNRIIQAAQAQMAPQPQRDENISDEESGEETESVDAEARAKTHNGQAHAPVNGSGPQPEIDGTPAEVALGEDGAAARANGSASPEEASSDSASAEQSGNGATRRPRRTPRTRRAPRQADAAPASDDGGTAAGGTAVPAGDGADAATAAASGE
jgi:hypothetical protein